MNSNRPMITPAMQEVIRLRPLQAPVVRLAASKSGNTVAMWVDGQWVAVLTMDCRGGWVRMWGLPLINGQPAVADADWIE